MSAAAVQGRLLAELRQIDHTAPVMAISIGGFTGGLRLHLASVGAAMTLAERLNLTPTPPARHRPSRQWSGPVDGVQVTLAVLGVGGR